MLAIAYDTLKIMNKSKPVKIIEHAGHIEVELSGFLEPGTDAYLSELRAIVQRKSNPVGLLYSMSQVEGYSRDVALAHSHAFRVMTPNITGIAVVSTTGVVRIGITFVSILSGAKMKGFDSKEPAVSWLDDLSQVAILSPGH